MPCIFCGISLSFPVISCAQQLASCGASGVLLKTSENNLEIFQVLRTFPNSSDHDRKFSDELRILPKIFEKLKKKKNRKNSFESFLKFSENFLRFSENLKPF